MPAIYHEGSWLGNATDPEVLVKDTVGWTGKNRAYSQTNNAVIAHIENGITYDVSWTGSATVTLKKNSASGATITSGSTSPLSFTADADYELYFGSSATVTNIMVKDSRITDPTYEPYHESVEVMYEEEIHGVNLIPFPYNMSDKTGTGITYTTDNNGVLTVNGTASGVNSLFLTRREGMTGNKMLLNAGSYKATGGLSSGICLLIGETVDGSYSQIGKDTGGGVLFTLTKDTYVQISVDVSVNVSNQKVYPMLRKADIEDSTYRPYNPQAIQNQLNAQGVLGAKNLLRLNAGQGIGTYNGLTVTNNYNSDGTIKNVVFNGTSTQSASGNFYQFAQRMNNNPIKLTPNTTYIFSIDNQNENVSLQVGYTKNNSYFMVKESPYGADSLMFVAPSDCEGAGWTIQLIKKTGSLVLNNWTVYPMLRLASDPDDTYQPYAMTNRELTEKVFEKRILTSADDLDDILETGIYEVATAPANSPENWTYYTLLVEARNAADARQIAFVPKTSSCVMYMRSRGGSPVSWKSWYKFTGTVVS